MDEWERYEWLGEEQLIWNSSLAFQAQRLEDGGGDKTNILPVAEPLRLNASGSASKGRAARAGGSRVALLTSYSESTGSET